MSKTYGPPSIDEPDVTSAPVRSPGNLFADFPSEREIGSPAQPVAPTSDELEWPAATLSVMRASAGVASLSVVRQLIIAATLVTAFAGGFVGSMMSGNSRSGDLRSAGTAATRADVTPHPRPAAAHPAAAATLVIEPTASATHAQSPQTGRRNAGRAPAYSHAVRSTRVTAVAADGRSSDEVQVPATLLPSANPPFAFTPAPVSPTAQPAMSSSFAPAELRVSATASDPERDALTYLWSAPAGRFVDATGRETVYVCPDTPGTVALTVTVSDGHGGFASDELTIHCVAPR